jgi:hypothetical protein
MGYWRKGPRRARKVCLRIDPRKAASRPFKEGPPTCGEVLQGTFLPAGPPGTPFRVRRARAPSLQASFIPGLFSVGTLEKAGFAGVFEVFYRRIGAASDRMFPAEFAERLST